jgi:hypothetical protein
MTQQRSICLTTGLQLSSNRREFLRNAGLTLGSTLLRSPFARAANINPKKKFVVVTFGGGARDQETFAPEGQENIPNMMHDLLPRATFFTQVVNRGILGHYVATASLATGVYETINNFASLPPENPTVFEYYRKDLKRPSSDAWVVAPSNGFNRMGESNHRSYGPGFGARVVLPKYLLKAAMSKSGADYQHLLATTMRTLITRRNWEIENSNCSSWKWSSSFRQPISGRMPRRSPVPTSCRFTLCAS